jgi:tRNA (adenine57-N1/adenine58-N1)-methyltransferase
VIQTGDYVMIYSSERMNYLVRVPAKGRFSTHRGHIEYSDIAGREFGDAVRTHMGVQFFLLRPTLADLALKVKRTTTVVYPKDVGLLLLQTMVFPGARVIEVGSGSGALTAILASFVRPEGRVFSYERRPEFSANARANVERYGLEQHCEFVVADPEVDGFGQTDADAVLLDVPEPWRLVRAARAALRTGNAVAAIVPTVEQVRKTVSALEMDGFVRIRTREMLEREWYVRATGVRPADRMVAHTVFSILAHKSSQVGLVRSDAADDADGPVGREE